MRHRGTVAVLAGLLLGAPGAASAADRGVELELDHDGALGKVIVYVDPVNDFPQSDEGTAESAGPCYLTNDSPWVKPADWDFRGEAPIERDLLIQFVAGGMAAWEEAASTSRIFGDQADGAQSFAQFQALPSGLGAITILSLRQRGQRYVPARWITYYNSAHEWAFDGRPDALDFPSVATHETGHVAGLGHPAGSCTEETMYGGIAFGEVKKRDLHTGDIAGIRALY